MRRSGAFAVARGRSAVRLPGWAPHPGAIGTREVPA